MHAEMVMNDSKKKKKRLKNMHLKCLLNKQRFLLTQQSFSPSTEGIC